MLVRCDNVTQTPRLKCVNYIDMRKNGSREITFSQYRTTDLFLFAIIVAVAELFTFAATQWFPEEALFTFSFTLPIAIMVMMRWGWPAAFYAAEGALIQCALRSAAWQFFVSYAAGNAAVVVVLGYLLPIGKDKVAASWYLSVGMFVIAWCVQVLARSALLTATGAADFVTALAFTCGISSDCGLLSLVMGIIVILVVRRFDGLFEDQKSYLKRLGKMRDEKRKIDTFGEQLEEIDEENLSILNRDDDLY